MTDTLLPAQLVDAARKVLDANRAAGRRIAVAESCTGGLVAAALPEIAGSSDVFETCFVTYSNESKMELLKISLDVLETFGSVSIDFDSVLAQGVLGPTRAGVDVDITGMFGPDGGRGDNPKVYVVFLYGA